MKPEKPLSVARVDFVKELSRIISESGLPICMIADILNDGTIKMSKLADELYQKEKAEYEKQLEKEED